MSAYEYLTIETMPVHAILDQLMRLEAQLFAANARIRAALEKGDREDLAVNVEAHRSYGEQIDALLREQDRRAALPADVVTEEHPPELFELRTTPATGGHAGP